MPSATRKTNPSNGRDESIPSKPKTENHEDDCQYGRNDNHPVPGVGMNDVAILCVGTTDHRMSSRYGVDVGAKRIDRVGCLIAARLGAERYIEKGHAVVRARHLDIYDARCRDDRLLHRVSGAG